MRATSRGFFLGLSIALGGWAQDETPQLFRDAVATLKLADDAEFATERIPHYRRALEQFDAVLADRPDAYPAHANAAHCVNQLAQLVADPDERRQLLQEASRRYEAATKFPQAEPRLYGSWASLLIAESAIDSQRSRELLQRAINVARTGISKTPSKAEQARLSYQMGRAQFFLAQTSAARHTRRDLYEDAIANFNRAATVDSVAGHPQLYSTWGLALLELYRLRPDRMLLLQGVERLQTGLEKEADNQTVRYNLACGYALLGQTEIALRHLRTCLDNDDERQTYLHTARRDPDLNSLRTLPAFNELVGDVPATPASPFEKPLRLLER